LIMTKQKLNFTSEINNICCALQVLMPHLTWNFKHQYAASIVAERAYLLSPVIHGTNVYNRKQSSFFFVLELRYFDGHSLCRQLIWEAQKFQAFHVQR
jgi:hypothetical protein